MKKNKTIKSIYSRIFGILIITYLTLMLVFSWLYITQEKKAAGLEFGSFALHISRRVDNILSNYIDQDHNITDKTKMKKELAIELSNYAAGEVEIAIFTDDYELMLNTNDYWPCSYTEYIEGNRHYNGHGFINPKDWFVDDEIREIEEYVYAYPKAEEVGDLAGYSVSLEGLWVDNEIIIPNKIVVSPMYATSFDENGDLKSSSGTHTNEIVYVTEYDNNKGLPYYNHGAINPGVYNPSYNSKRHNELRQIVTDKSRLEETILQFFSRNIVQRTDALTYRYYMPMPYTSEVKSTDEQQVHSIFWTVVGRNINLWERLNPTLPFVWLSCFITFLVSGIIISRQTYKTYMKQEEIDRQRKEMTDALAHDLKTPLSIISGYAQNLLENIHTEKREHYATHINSNVKRMDQIISKMLEMSKIESDYFELKLEEASLGEICTGIINRYKLLCHEKFITISLEGDAIIGVDKSLIERVIDNFLINAIDNMQEGGIIRISILDDIFEIYNSGSHIPEDKIKDIWYPYKKSDAQRSNTKGTGLGLAISRTILELHKFSYGAKNNEDGVIFWFKYH